MIYRFCFLLPYFLASSLFASVPLLKPSASQIQVHTVAELVSALGRATPGQTLMLADGLYDLASVEPLRIRADSVTLYGASQDPTKVVFKGQGFGSANINEEMIKVEASHTTLAYFTIRDVRSNGLKIQTGTNDSLLVHNVNFVDICERSIKGPDVPISKGGIVRYCLFEQVTSITSDIPSLNAGGDYIAGMDMMKIDGWHIHDNTFKNIRGMTGGGRAAVFLWNGCKRVLVERNLFLGCDRAIAFGNPSGPVSDMDSGSIRTNFIVAGVGNAIEVCHGTSNTLYHNTVFSANPAYSRTLFFFDNGTNNEVKNNLVLGHLSVQSGTSPDTSGNLFIGSAPSWFRDATSGDLHLTSVAGGAINKGVPMAQNLLDFDSETRDGMPDIGADEFLAGVPILKAPARTTRLFRGGKKIGIHWNGNHSGMDGRALCVKP